MDPFVIARVAITHASDIVVGASLRDPHAFVAQEGSAAADDSLYDRAGSTGRKEPA